MGLLVTFAVRIGTLQLYVNRCLFTHVDVSFLLFYPFYERIFTQYFSSIGRLSFSWHCHGKLVFIY